MAEPELDQPWLNVIKESLREWGWINKDLAVFRLAPLMPPGYAWQRYVIDGKLRQRLEKRGLWEEGDPFPAPESLEDYVKAQRALVKWWFRSMKRAGTLIERDGKVCLSEKTKDAPLKRSTRRTGSV